MGWKALILTAFVVLRVLGVVGGMECVRGLAGFLGLEMYSIM